MHEAVEYEALAAVGVSERLPSLLLVDEMPSQQENDLLKTQSLASQISTDHDDEHKSSRDHPALSERLRDLDEGMHVFNEPLELSITITGCFYRNSSRLAVVEYNLGQMHTRDKRYNLAKESFQRCLERLQESGPSQPYSNNQLSGYKVLHNIGYSCYCLGRKNEALDFYQKALSEATSQMGINPTEIALCANCIAVLHLERNGPGDSEKALSLFNQAATFVHSEDYPRELAIFYRKVATVYCEQGIYTHSIRFLREAAFIYHQRSDVPNAIEILQDIGRVFSTSKDYRSALVTLQQVYNLELDRHGAFSEQTASTLSDMGLLQYLLRDYDSALRLYQEALHIRSTRSAIETSQKLKKDLGNSFNAVGLVLLKLKDYDSSKKAFLECLGLRQAVRPTPHQEIASALYNLGTCEMDRGHVDEGLRIYSISLQIEVKGLGSYHPDVCRTLQCLGQIYQQLGRFEQSLEYYEIALKVARNLLAKYQYTTNVQSVCRILNSLGNIELMLGKAPEMMDYLVEATRTAARLHETENEYTSIEVIGHFFYGISRLNPTCAPSA